MSNSDLPVAGEAQAICVMDQGEFHMKFRVDSAAGKNSSWSNDFKGGIIEKRQQSETIDMSTCEDDKGSLVFAEGDVCYPEANVVGKAHNTFPDKSIKFALNRKTAVYGASGLSFSPSLSFDKIE